MFLRSQGKSNLQIIHNLNIYLCLSFYREKHHRQQCCCYVDILIAYLVFNISHINV